MRDWKTFLVMACLIGPLAAFAEPAAGPVKGAPQGVMKTNEKNTKAPKKKRRLPEKETDGTEAADRFEANTVIKSHYEQNGEALEVDPD